MDFGDKVWRAHWTVTRLQTRHLGVFRLHFTILDRIQSWQDSFCNPFQFPRFFPVIVNMSLEEKSKPQDGIHSTSVEQLDLIPNLPEPLSSELIPDLYYRKRVTVRHMMCRPRKGPRYDEVLHHRHLIRATVIGLRKRLLGNSCWDQVMLFSW